MHIKVKTIQKTLKAVHIFISSTFRDMNVERDCLNRFVFPELHSCCQKQGIEFVGVDLRWGVTEEEAVRFVSVNSFMGQLL